MNRLFYASVLLASSCAAQTTKTQAPVYTMLYTPPSLTVPESDPISILEAWPGLFYVVGARETTDFGYSIFSVTSTGAVNPAFSFPISTSILSLVQATNGWLFGAGFAQPAKSEYYFSLGTALDNLQEYPFPGAWGPFGETVVSPPAEFFDLVGAFNSHGTSEVYGFARISEQGKITILHQFSGTEGAPTGANLVYGPDGNFYTVGNQQRGGISPGFIIRMTPQGEYSQLLSFPAFPSHGLATPLVSASDGNLYGTFGGGGVNNTGELFQATLSGKLQITSFPAQGPSQPLTLMEAADGNLYGSTNYNTIFRYNLKTRALTTAYQMALNGAQGRCPCPLIHGMDGKLYGVASFGGPYPGQGTVFSLDLGLPRPKPAVSALYPTSGASGTRVLLWGKCLLAATSVTFNGVPATTLTVTSGQSVWVTVPSGATTGPITITTPNGSFTTAANFTVQ